MENNIRVIQYLGSKMRISEYIESEIDRITPKGSVVADVFSGSGVVAHCLTKNYAVYANDVQAYCRVINNVLLSDSSEVSVPTLDEIRESKAYKDNRKKLEKIFSTALKHEMDILTKGKEDDLVDISQYGVFYDSTNVIEEKKELNRRYFRDAIKCFDLSYIKKAKEKKEYILFCLYYLNSYFSLEQCIEIDSLRCAIDKVYSSNEVVKNILLACLMHSVSEIVCSVGKNFAQPMKLVDGKGKIKQFALNRCLRDRNMSVDSSFSEMRSNILAKENIVHDNNKVFCADAISFVNHLEENEVATFYLDPPYTIDHYSRFYHVLETLVLYDYPELEKKKMSGKIVILNGRYRSDRFQSNFCIPSKGLSEFKAMIKAIKTKKGKIVLSYSDSADDLDTRKRVVSLAELEAIMKEYYSVVEIIRINHRYRKLSDKETSREEMSNGELLFVCYDK